MRTLGQRVFSMEPASGFAAQARRASSIYLATHLGYPLSTTHVISGAVMGAGATKRLSAVRWGVAGNIAVAWVLTIPMAALRRRALLLAGAGDLLMLKRMLQGPRTSEFYELLAAGGENALAAAKAAESRFRDYPTGVGQDEIKELEHEGDRITGELIGADQQRSSSRRSTATTCSSSPARSTTSPTRSRTRPSCSASTTSSSRPASRSSSARSSSPR